MTRSAGPLLACALALVSGQANAPAAATPPTAVHPEAGQPTVPIEPQPPAANPPTADDVCRMLEQSAAENALPAEFFARVIWQESRFNARPVSPKGASGIAQFMPQTAGWHGLADPFDPIEGCYHSAGYLRELRDRFGNLGLAAAACNAGPGRVSAWSSSHRPPPGETRNYVATGWTVDEWASGSPPQTADTTIPQGVPCTRLANLILAPKEEAKRIATYIPRWGIWLAAPDLARDDLAPLVTARQHPPTHRIELERRGDVGPGYADKLGDLPLGQVDELDLTGDDLRLE
jgi:hypothetical protein